MTTYATFQKCYDENLKQVFKAGGYGDPKVMDTAIKFFGKIESDLQCSGACAKPLFGISRNIADGPATVECMEVIIESLDTLLAPGIVCLLTFFVLLCAVCGSIPICTGFDKDEEEMGE